MRARLGRFPARRPSSPPVGRVRRTICTEKPMAPMVIQGMSSDKIPRLKLSRALRESPGIGSSETPELHRTSNALVTEATTAPAKTHTSQSGSQTKTKYSAAPKAVPAIRPCASRGVSREHSARCHSAKLPETPQPRRALRNASTGTLAMR